MNKLIKASVAAALVFGVCGSAMAVGFCTPGTNIYFNNVAYSGTGLSSISVGGTSISANSNVSCPSSLSGASSVTVSGSGIESKTINFTNIAGWQPTHSVNITYFVGGNPSKPVTAEGSCKESILEPGYGYGVCYQVSGTSGDASGGWLLVEAERK